MSAALIRQILPPTVAVAELAGDGPAGCLLPQEEPFVSRAVDKRRDEFSAGRACARAAMAELGLPPVAIPVGPGGAPVWPDGITGSITHCDGYRSAIVARASAIRSIGIDGEPGQPLPQGVLERIASDGEVAHLAEVGAIFPGVPWDLLLFSAKESVYKAWYPLAGQWLDFSQVSVEIMPGQGSFTALVCHPRARSLGISEMNGCWAAGSGIIVTAVLVPV